MPKNKIFINGRFLTGTLTGVQRTAYEMVTALDELIDDGKIDVQDTSFELIYSGTLVNPIALNHIKLVKRGLLTGNLWEQLELPIYSFGKLLINMCSIAPLMKRKQIVFVHDISFKVNPDFFSTAFRIWYNFAIPLLGMLCRCIVTVSEFSKTEMIRLLGIPAEKIAVIYNAADHILRYGMPSRDFMDRIDAAKPYCLAVSSLGANKNFKGLSEALKQTNFGDYQMLVAGGGITALKYVTPDDGPTYLGYVSDEELSYLYTNASLFIFPSFYEGFGIPPLEAMLSGCPVIASRTSSIPEVLADACAYLDPYNTHDMGNRITALLRSPERLKYFRKKGLIRALSYSWEDSALALTSLILKHHG